MPVIDPVVEAAKARLEAQRLAAEEKKRIDQQSIADYLRFETSYMSEQKKAALKNIEAAKRDNNRILALNDEQYTKGLKNFAEYNKAKVALTTKSADLLKQENSIVDPSALNKLKVVADKAGSYISSTFSGFGLNIRSIAGPAGLALLVQQFIKINTQLREADRTIRQISGISGSPYLQNLSRDEGSKAVGREATSLYPDISRMSMRYQLDEKALLQESFQMAFKGRFKEEEVEGKEANEKDIISRLLEETIGLGQVSGLGRGAMQDYYQQMHVSLGVETNKLKVEFKELYDIASELDGPLNNFIANSIKMSQQMILYGFELDSAKVYTKLFADELDKGKTSLTSIANMLTGVEDQPGPLAYLASQMTDEQWERLLPGEGVTSKSDPLTQVGALRSVVDKALPERLEVLMDIAQQDITRLAGGITQKETGPDKYYRQTVESMYLPAFKLTSSDVREMRVQLLKGKDFQESGGFKADFEKLNKGSLLKGKEKAEFDSKKEKEATAFSKQGENALIDTASTLGKIYDKTIAGMNVVDILGKMLYGAITGKTAVETLRSDIRTGNATQEAEKSIKDLLLREQRGEITKEEAIAELPRIRKEAGARATTVETLSRDIVNSVLREYGGFEQLYGAHRRVIIGKRGSLTEPGSSLEKKHQGGVISGRYLGEEVPILAQAGEEIIPIDKVGQKRGKPFKPQLDLSGLTEQLGKLFKPQLDLSVDLPTADLNSFNQKRNKNLYLNVGPFSFDSSEQENTFAMIEDAMEEATKRVKEEYYQAQKFK